MTERARDSARVADERGKEGSSAVFSSPVSESAAAAAEAATIDWRNWSRRRCRHELSNTQVPICGAGAVGARALEQRTGVCQEPGTDTAYIYL